MSEIPDNPIEVWEQYHNGIPESTMSNKLSALGRFSEWLCDNGNTDNVLEVKLIDVQNWLVHLYQTEELAGSTVNQYHNELRGFYNAWINEGGNRSLLAEQEYELPENPASFDLSEYLDFSKTTKKQNYADNNQGIIHVKPSEVQKLRESVESVRDELLIKILHQTGLRRSEVSALKLPQHKSDSHIDTEKKQVVISEADSKTDNGGNEQ
jgi:site-specific recombinase XerD